MHNLLLIGTRLGLGDGGHRGELSGFDLIYVLSELIMSILPFFFLFTFELMCDASFLSFFF
jgi:hypothetical protein